MKINERKIDFIVAYNDESYFEECCFYIGQLAVPDGYEIGMLGIRDGLSMTSAYNEGMSASEAKYKVYLHQDVFIFHKDFMEDILAIFQRDKSIGMIGVLGGIHLPEDAIYYRAWNIGRVKADNAINVLEVNFQDPDAEEPYLEAEAIDGMMMITQYDLPWREDLFQGWDFYDASQSFEFRRAGYRIVVPRQKEAWCLHDCGVSKLKDYDNNRSIFIREYLNKKAEVTIAGQTVFNEARYKSLTNIRNHIVNLYGKEDLSSISNVLKQTDIVDLMLTELRAMKNVLEIYSVEKSDPDKDWVMFTDHYFDWERTYILYREIKFLVRRIEQGYTDKEYVGELMAMYREKRISPNALVLISMRAVTDWKKVVGLIV